MAMIGFEIFEWEEGELRNIGGVRIIEGELAVDAPEWVRELARQNVGLSSGRVMEPSASPAFLRVLAHRIGGFTRAIIPIEGDAAP